MKGAVHSERHIHNVERAAHLPGRVGSLIDDILNHPWVQSIEVFYLVPKPKHVHQRVARMGRRERVHVP